MKVKYPVKYALLPIYEQTGWTPGVNELEREYGIRAYIVSKVYVKKEMLEYHNDGTTKKKYYVVYPYVRDLSLDVWRRDDSFAFDKNSEEVVEELFDTYEEAKKVANAKHKAILDKDKRDIFNSCIITRSKYIKPSDQEISSNIHKAEEEYALYLEKIKSIEEQILDKTTDMDETRASSGKRSAIIVIGKAEDKVLYYDIYQYIKYFHDKPFRVYKVSEDDFEVLRRQIESHNENIEFPNAEPLFYSSPKSGMIKIGDKYIKVDFYKTTTLDKDKIDPAYLEEANRPTYGESFTYVFTTEPLEDIILSYKEHPYIRARELK